MDYITLTNINLASEHICCAISDKKCQQSYEAKKAWLGNEFERGYVFTRITDRAKVFIEYGPAENAWLPISADNYLALGCFWVSGKYKNHGHGKALLNEALEAAKQQNKSGLVTVVGKKKFHFMSDTKWLLKQGFEIADEAPNGFLLLHYPMLANAAKPSFLSHVHSPKVESTGCVVYYSNRCPYAEYHVMESLRASCEKRNIPLKTIKLKTVKQAQKCPSPATIFSMFYNGKFITTDISACMDSRFDKFI